MNTSPRWLYAIAALTILSLIGGGIWFYQNQRHSLRQQVNFQLLAIAQLKANQIIQWREERLSDGGILAESDFFGEALAQWIAHPQIGNDEPLMSQLRSLQKYSHYRNVTLIDSNGQIKLSLSGKLGPSQPDVAKIMALAFRSRKVLATDLYTSVDNSSPFLGIVVPFFSKDGLTSVPLGAVILEFSARDFLYPMMESWPVPSVTAETILVRRDGDAVLYLNELRHQTNTALKLRIPLTQTNVPAVMAVLGKQGVMEGRDYRGIEVLSALKAIPDSPWFLVAKMDVSETNADWRVRSVAIIGMVFGMVLAVGGLAGIMWQRNAKIHFQALLLAEAQQRQSENRYRSLFSNMMEGLAECHMIFEGDQAQDFVYLSVNKSFETLTGLKNVEGKRVTEVIPGLTKLDHSLIEICGRVARTGKPERCEVFVKALDQWYSISIYSSAQDHFVAVFDVITERKRAEVGLHRLASIVESSSDAIILKDRDGIILEWNAAAERIYGYSAAEIVGKPISLLVPPDKTEDLKILGMIQHGERINHYETLRVRKDGRLVHISLSGAPILDAEGKIIGGSTIARDITERKRTEELVRQAQTIESLAVLAGGIAHDFNNLLMAVLGSAEALKWGLPADSPSFNHIHLIEDAVQRAAELCKQMLVFAGRAPRIVSPVNLSSLVHEFTPLLRSSISKKIELAFQLAENPPAIEADSAQVRQVVMNLVINASEAIGDKPGTISVSTRTIEPGSDCLANCYGALSPPSEAFICLEVADTGCGIDAETQRKIFEPFFSTKFVGRGLGLASVLGIVQSHQGAIKLESQPGLGTAFKVFFPVSKKTAFATALPQQPVELEPGGGTILLVEDEELVRKVTQAVLAHCGYKVFAAADGCEAIKLFQEHVNEIGCVLLDTEMPQKDGAETCRELQKINPNIKVIVASGFGEKDSIKRFAGMPLAGFLHKPYQIDALRNKLSEVFGRNNPNL